MKIARLLGENKNKEVRSTLNFCLYAMAFAGMILLLAGILFIAGSFVKETKKVSAIL